MRTPVRTSHDAAPTFDGRAEKRTLASTYRRACRAADGAIRATNAARAQNAANLFRLNEYAAAETAFIGTTLHELSHARGGIVGLVGREPAARVGTTQVTLEGGQTLEFEAVAIGAPMSLQWEDIANTRIEALLETLDEAAETHHNELTDYVLGHLEALTAATGNQIDATGKSFFEYMYEMFESVELSFEPDGSISPGFGFVMHPDTLKAMKKKEAAMTDEERRKLDELVARKRGEYFARRRSRRLS